MCSSTPWELTIHINLNMIFYTRVEHSPTKTVYIKYYAKNKNKMHHKHTHTHNDGSRNWVLVLVRMEILGEEEAFHFGFKRWQGWAVSKILWEWIPNVGSKRCESHESCVCIVGFPACRCQKKSVVYETECRHAAVQRGKQGQNHL